MKDPTIRCSNTVSAAAIRGSETLKQARNQLNCFVILSSASVMSVCFHISTTARVIRGLNTGLLRFPGFGEEEAGHPTTTKKLRQLR